MIRSEDGGASAGSGCAAAHAAGGVPVSVEYDGGPVYAGLTLRTAAIVLDLLFLSAAFTVSTRLARGSWFLTTGEHRWATGWFVTDPLCLVFLATMFLYFLLFEGLSGWTPGKRALGLRVTATDGRRPGLGRALVRNALRVVDGLPTLGIVGAILIATSPERARFGDRVAETRVVLVTPSPSVERASRASG